MTATYRSRRSRADTALYGLAVGQGLAVGAHHSHAPQWAAAGQETQPRTATDLHCVLLLLLLLLLRMNGEFWRKRVAASRWSARWAADDA